MIKVIEKLKRIRWREGSGSVYIGTMVLFVAFAAGILIVEQFNLFNTATKTQIVTDALADGATIAAVNPSGIDEEILQNVAHDLIEQNDVGQAQLSYQISAAPEYDENSNKTGNTLVTAHVKADQPYYMPQYLIQEDRFQSSATAVVRVETPTDSNGWITVSMAENPNAVIPFATTSTEHRNSAYVTWFINHYLNPEYNKLYKAKTGADYGNYFLYDYLMCMGFSPNSCVSRSADEWANYFFDTGRTSADGWFYGKDPSSIQAAANEGKVVVVVQRERERGNVVLSIGMPAQGALKNTELAIAGAGKENSNYKRVEFETLFAEFDTVIVIHN